MSVRSAGEYSSQHSVETAEETTSQGHGYAHQGDVPQVLRFHPVKATNRSGCSCLSLSLSLSISHSRRLVGNPEIAHAHTGTHVRLRFPMARRRQEPRPRTFRMLFLEGRGGGGRLRREISIDRVVGGRVETLRVGTYSTDGTRISSFH